MGEFSVILQEIISSLGFRELLDIVIVATLIYLGLIFIRETRSFFIFSTLLILSGVVYLSELIDLGLTRQLFQPFLTFFLLIIVIVFQKEIRRFFEWFSIPKEGLLRFKRNKNTAGLAQKISQAVNAMIKEHVGALIVLAGVHPLEHSIEGGIELGGKVSVPLLLSIFNTETPGHDGAVIIEDGKIKYFGAHLPLAQKVEGLTRAGTRHRAATGLTEETDALVIVVSEERGIVSLAQNGHIKQVSKDVFIDRVSSFIREQAIQKNDKSRWWDYLLIENWIEKLISIIFALVLWIVFIFY
ncbi:TIGR00159 family protein [bacterium]|nr:TIGR00159 family protein [bacterium]|tara:strand:+ start:7345 stop:8241 length:897 start_codon:yes stop_codon:yes gene_type:complete